MKTIMKPIMLCLAAVIAWGCADEFELDYKAPVAISFEGVDDSNIVTLDYDETSYTAKIRVSGTTELSLLELYASDPKTGALIGSPLEEPLREFPEKTSFSYDYTIPSILENTGLLVQVTDVDGGVFQRRLLVKITPSVIFSDAVKMETAEAYYGIYFASWYSGRTYMRNNGVKYAKEIDFSLGEVAAGEGLPTSPMFVSPAQRGEYGLMNIDGVQDTQFALTNLTVAEFDAITRRDLTTIQGVADPTLSAVLLQNNKVYVFKTAAGRKGLIKVTGLVDKVGTIEVTPDNWVENTPYRLLTVTTKMIAQ